MNDYRLTPTGNPLTEEQIEEFREEFRKIQSTGTWLPAGSNVLCDMALAALRAPSPADEQDRNLRALYGEALELTRQGVEAQVDAIPPCDWCAAEKHKGRHLAGCPNEPPPAQPSGRAKGGAE